MKSPAVQAYCVGMWDARELGKLPDAFTLSRGLAMAVAEDVVNVRSYDPYEDRRVEWAHAVVRQRTWQKPDLRPEADAVLEDVAAWLLGRQAPAEPCGKDFAAGEGREG